MGALSDALPQGLLEASVRRQLVPGVVIYIWVHFRSGKPKEKRVVVLSATETTTVGVLVNSELHPLLVSREATKRAQIPVSPKSCKFVEHDSFINCAELHRFTTDAVVKELMGDPILRILPAIDDESRKKIIVELKTSSTIVPAETRPLIAALGA